MKILVPFPDLRACIRTLHTSDLKAMRTRAVATADKLLQGAELLEDDQAAWLGLPAALAEYASMLCREYARRMRPATDPLLSLAVDLKRKAISTAGCAAYTTMPVWFGDAEVHRSHMAELLRTRPNWYRVRTVPFDISEYEVPLFPSATF